MDASLLNSTLPLFIPASFAMNEDTSVDTKRQHFQLIRAGRIGFCIIFLIGSLSNIYAVIFAVPKFEQIYREMLADTTLPAITSFILAYHSMLIALSLALLVVGILVCWFASPKRAFDVIGALMVVTFIHIAMTVYALFAPLVSVVA